MKIAAISKFLKISNNQKNTNEPSYNHKFVSYAQQDTISFKSNQKKLFNEMNTTIKKEIGGRLEPLLDKKTVQKRVKELATTINADYKGEDVYIICVLNGAKRFADDLTKQMKRKINGTIKLSSYEGTDSTDNIKMSMENLPNIKYARNILVVEDIIDTGKSMHFLLNKLKETCPQSKLKLCALLDKPEARQEGKNVKADYRGFKIEKEFVIGYGLDYNNQGRELDAIYRVARDKKI